MSKIKMNIPLVEMDGDEMTRVIWSDIKELVIEPFIDYKGEYFDLGLVHRNETDDQVTLDAAKRTSELGVAVKCATITPNAQRMNEYQLKQMWKSPNGTIRSYLDGTVFRSPIMVPGIEPHVRSWKKPITLARHAYGDVYKNVELIAQAGDQAYLVIDKADGTSERMCIHKFTGDGVIQGVHNTDHSIYQFAKTCLQYGLEHEMDVWFSTKDTISKQYDHRFKDIFESVYQTEFKRAYEEKGLTFFYTLIDDAVARVMRDQGGFLWACKNYDGDVMSDMIASANGSLAMMTSVLVSPNGVYEYEAAHGTVTRHYVRYLNGEQTSTNPMATLFAWTGALKKRGELDQLEDLVTFAEKVESTSIQTIQDGYMTGDLAVMFNGEVNAVLDTRSFLEKIVSRL